MNVPFFSSTPVSQRSLCSSPQAKVTVWASPSRTERAVNSLESMFTALTPTPFSPTVFLKALPSSYLPPVFMTLTAGASILSGMPRP